MAHTYRLNKNKDINLLISGVRTRFLIFLPPLFPIKSRTVNENKMISNESNVCDDKASYNSAIPLASNWGRKFSIGNHKKCTKCSSISCTMKAIFIDLMWRKESFSFCSFYSHLLLLNVNICSLVFSDFPLFFIKLFFSKHPHHSQPTEPHKNLNHKINEAYWKK